MPSETGRKFNRCWLFVAGQVRLGHDALLTGTSGISLETKYLFGEAQLYGSSGQRDERLLG